MTLGDNGNLTLGQEIGYFEFEDNKASETKEGMFWINGGIGGKSSSFFWQRMQYLEFFHLS
jgi:hypothetical protein